MKRCETNDTANIYRTLMILIGNYVKISSTNAGACYLAQDTVKRQSKNEDRTKYHAASFVSEILIQLSNPSIRVWKMLALSFILFIYCKLAILRFFI